MTTSGRASFLEAARSLMMGLEDRQEQILGPREVISLGGKRCHTVGKSCPSWEIVSYCSPPTLPIVVESVLMDRLENEVSAELM